MPDGEGVGRDDGAGVCVAQAVEPGGGKGLMLARDALRRANLWFDVLAAPAAVAVLFQVEPRRRLTMYFVREHRW